MLASVGKKTKSPANRSLTLSFSSEEVLPATEVNYPKVDLNDVFIDLTNSPKNSQANGELEAAGSSQNGIACVQGRNKVQKTIQFSMGIGKGATKTENTLISRHNLRSSARKNENVSVEQQYENMFNTVDPNEPGPSRRATKVRPSMLEPCYKKLLEMENKPLIENYDAFNCILCKKFIAKGKGVVLKQCIHSFCMPCLIHVIKSNPTEKYGKVDCPHQPEKCESQISDEEIKALLGDEHDEFLQNHSNSTEALLPYLLEMDDLIPNYKVFECKVCFMDVGIGEGLILKNCLHNGCKDCLGQLIMHAEEFEVKCPHVENEVGCNEFIQEKEMRYLLSSEDFDKHLKKSLKIAEHVNELNFHCRGVDCENFVELEENIQSFRCDLCGAVNCVRCKAVHPGKTCLDYQEEAHPEKKDARLKNENKESEEAIAAEVAAGISMLCPRCNIPVMKITGCDFITCTACKLGICWITRKPRKDFKRGNGELVEGCKCKEGPGLKRCHPNCGNCH